ncbi:MAG: caspase family protein [Muribaculaceae bacterium]|nr:caspase family protein [Muribaculaceae bacterium]
MIRRLIITLLFGTLAVVYAGAINRALLVGIGKYDQAKTGWSPVHGDNDVALLRPLLDRRGFKDMVVLVDEKATKNAIVEALKALAQRCKPDDKVYFHFSGHGQPIRDDNRDELNVRKDKRYDESIIPYDACRDTRRLNGTYIGQYHLIDDELCPLLDAIKRKVAPSGEVFVVVDACYSKGIQKDEITDLEPELLRYLRGTEIAFIPPGRKSFVAGIPKPKNFTPGGLLTVVTACRENERNFEYRSSTGRLYGSLSYYISILLKKDADFARWRKCFERKDYANRRIFQTIQHPSIEIFR